MHGYRHKISVLCLLFMAFKVARQHSNKQAQMAEHPQLARLGFVFGAVWYNGNIKN